MAIIPSGAKAEHKRQKVERQRLKAVAQADRRERREAIRRELAEEAPQHDAPPDRRDPQG
jgi:hypothetical protein